MNQALIAFLAVDDLADMTITTSSPVICGQRLSVMFVECRDVAGDDLLGRGRFWLRKRHAAHRHQQRGAKSKGFQHEHLPMSGGSATPLAVVLARIQGSVRVFSC